MTLAGDPASPTVIDRRRIDLTSPRISVEAYHAARVLSPRQAEHLITRASEAARVNAARAIRGLCDELGLRGFKVVGTGVVLGSGHFALPLTRSLLSHAGSHAAEGELYRQALIQGSTSCHLKVTAMAERDLYDQGAGALALSTGLLRERIATLGEPIGAPWTQDQKGASIVAWLALRQSLAGRT